MWCRTSDIGTDSDVDLTLLNMITTAMKGQGLVFYEAEKEVVIPEVSFSWRGNDSGVVYLGQYVTDVKSAKIIYNGWADKAVLTVDRLEDNQYAVLSGVQTRPRSMSFVLTPGLAELREMTAQSEVMRGDSVIRDGAELVVDDPADYTFTAGDMLAEAALGFARGGDCGWREIGLDTPRSRFKVDEGASYLTVCMLS